MDENIVFLIIGLVVGAVFAVIVLLLLRKQNEGLKTQLGSLQEEAEGLRNTIQEKNNALQTQVGIAASSKSECEGVRNQFESLKKEIEELKATAKESEEKLQNQIGIAREKSTENDTLRQQLEEAKRELQSKTMAFNEKMEEVAKLNGEKSTLESRLKEHKDEILEAKKELTLTFKDMASSILKENTQTFTDSNKNNMNEILNPLKTQIEDFKKQIKESYDKEHDEKLSLKEEINNIVKAGNKLSQDAQNLTSALKGNSKIQGNWGEMQLERLLQLAGLEKNVHYTTQEQYQDDEGKRNIPDVVIKMPDNKNYVIDSKVSLDAYERFYNEEDEELRNRYWKEHLKSVKEHIDELSKKNYDRLYGIYSPDYVFMFMPIEPALTMALQEDPSLYSLALEKNVVLVSSTLLLATMRTVSFLWKQEKQHEYVQAIADEGGKLHDKFIEMLEELRKVGSSLKTCTNAYQKAINKLNDSPKRSTTIIASIERLKDMGANTKKELDPKATQELGLGGDVYNMNDEIEPE